MSGSYLLRRVLWALPTLFGVAVVVFVLVRVVPGDPISMMLPPGATAADVDRLRALYGLDASLPQQFISWFGGLLRGDLGTSISLRSDVLSLILSRLPATLELVAVAVIAASLLAALAAVTAVYFRGRWPEFAVDGATGLTLAIPDFLWGLIFILVLGVLLPLLPISGRIDPTLAFDPKTGFYLAEALITGQIVALGNLLAHIVLPAAALALPLAAALSRVLKGSLIEAMNQDFVVLARVKGYSRASILWRVALRNALIPTVTLTGVQFSFLIGGTVLIEYIFSYPGIGSMAIASVLNRDLPMIQGLVLTFAVLFILANLLVDMTYSLLDPRVQHG
jgi:ABC-type dipeptide/oligopeptide/nickel transport system permease component